MWEAASEALGTVRHKTTAIWANETELFLFLWLGLYIWVSHSSLWFFLFFVQGRVR